MSKPNRNMELTPREAAFILLCRRMGEGYFEGVGVNEGQPSVLKLVTQRIDLKRPEELDVALTEKPGTMIDMARRRRGNQTEP